MPRYINNFDNVDIVDINSGLPPKEPKWSNLSAATAFKKFDVEDGSVEGTWLLSPLEELIPTGEYEGNTMVAADAILVIADGIEFALRPPAST